MTMMFDAASPPPQFLSGERWGGYLDSPTAAEAWGQAKLQQCIDAGGLLLPIWVAPLTASGFRSRKPAREAVEALAQIGAIDAAHPVVALDVEERAFEAAPQLAVDWMAIFGATLDHQGAAAVFYSSKVCLKSLRKLHPTVKGAPWLAFYTANHTRWPVPGWPKPRAWQYAADQVHNGHTVDLSTVDAGFPFMTAVTVAPLSKLHRRWVSELTAAWAHRRVGFPAADGDLVDQLLTETGRVAQLPRR